jgi:hypothetical protein
VPTLKSGGYGKWADFRAWAATAGYAKVWLQDIDQWYGFATRRTEYDLLDADRSGGPLSPAEEAWLGDATGNTYLSDDLRDEDADGLSNIAEVRGNMTPGYWSACYSGNEAPFSRDGFEYGDEDRPDPTKADTDGDGIRDGADDQDFDDVPNIMEASRIAASSHDDRDSGVRCKLDSNVQQQITDKTLDRTADYGRVDPYNPCLPNPNARTCNRYFDFGEEPSWAQAKVWVALQ